MLKKDFAKTFRFVKIIQLCTFVVIDFVFILMLIFHSEVGTQIYHNKTLFFLCTITWILMICSFLFLLYDLHTIKFFAVESHALNKIAYLDHLTGIPNRHGLDVVFKTYDTPKSMTQIGCFMCTIANLHNINDSMGHQVGDRMILDFCAIFEEVGDNFGFVGRNGGNEFLMVMDSCTHDTMQNFIDKLHKCITQYNVKHSYAPIHIRHTYLLNTEEHAQAFTQLLTATYNKLHS